MSFMGIDALVMECSMSEDGARVDSTCRSKKNKENFSQKGLCISWKKLLRFACCCARTVVPDCSRRVGSWNERHTNFKYFLEKKIRKQHHKTHNKK